MLLSCPYLVCWYHINIRITDPCTCLPRGPCVSGEQRSICVIFKLSFIYNIVLVVSVQYCDSVVWQIILHKLPQGNGYNSLCYTVHPYCLSILHIIVCVYLIHTPNLSLTSSLSPLVSSFFYIFNSFYVL